MSPYKSLILSISIFMVYGSVACSMYKITHDGKTMVGCNEDAWRTESVIWFENANSHRKYGAGFTGSRKESKTKYAPQSGMNEMGLVFSRLTAYHPENKEPISDKKIITDEAHYLSDILHQCKTLKEVKNYVAQYDRSRFIKDVFIYIDSSGNYLIVEPYEFVEGNDATYVLSNFCPSITSKENARKLLRYKNGDDFLSNHPIDASLQYCRQVSDTMHVCRNRNGDGTLLTSIWDTKSKLVNLYFYHSYDSTVQFDLSAELAKGDHQISIPELFPVNAEFSRLSNYITPFNRPRLRVSLVLTAGFLALTSFLFLLSYFRKRGAKAWGSIKVIHIFLNTLLIAYLFVLATHVNLYYFDAPYQHYSSWLISISSYLPFVLILLIIPLGFFTLRYIGRNKKMSFLNGLSLLNQGIYILLIIGFIYWGFYDVF